MVLPVGASRLVDLDFLGLCKCRVHLKKKTVTDVSKPMILSRDIKVSHILPDFAMETSCGTIPHVPFLQLRARD